MSRYYDPEIRQFISPDTQDYLVPDTIGGVDLYAYCGYNPVMYVDPSGHVAITLLITIGVIVTGVLIGGIVGGVSAYNEGKSDWEIVLNVVIGASVGLAISGAILGVSGAGIIAFQNIMGVIKIAKGLRQLVALGMAAYNLEIIIAAALTGQEAPESVEWGSEPSVPVLPPPITGF